MLKKSTTKRPSQRDALIAEYFQTVEAMRRLSVGPHKFWHQQDDEITRTQLGVLMMIAYQQMSTIKQIAQCLGISSSAATQIVTVLADAGYLQRATDPNDRRSTILTLTVQGYKILKKKKAAFRDSFQELFAPLTDAELKNMTRYQQKILKHFNVKPLNQ